MDGRWTTCPRRYSPESPERAEPPSLFSLAAAARGADTRRRHGQLDRVARAGPAHDHRRRGSASSARRARRSGTSTTSFSRSAGRWRSRSSSSRTSRSTRASPPRTSPSGGVANARPGSFYDAFCFSVETMGTVGYGWMYPTSAAANAIMIVESVTSLIVTAVATGLVFAKFSRSSARVVVLEARRHRARWTACRR